MGIKRSLLLCVLSLLLVVNLVPVCVAEQPVRVLEIRTASFGGSAYKVGVVMEQIIHGSGHPWLQAVTLETTGGLENIRMLAERLSPEKRARTLILSSDSSYAEAREGKKPFKKPLKKGDLQVIFATPGNNHFFFTLDPNIKTPKDMIGKRIALPRKASVGFRRASAVLKAWGIFDKVHIDHAKWGEIANAVRDGIVAIGINHGTVADGKLEPTAKALAQLMYTKKIYIIGITREEIKKATEIAGFPLLYGEFPPGAVGAHQTETKGTLFIRNVNWWAWHDADSEMMYEMLKLIGANVKTFEKVLGKRYRNMTLSAMADLPVHSMAEVHPVAKRYFKEQGISIRLLE